MRVAVTGASGFIGRHLIADESHEWVALTRTPSCSAGHVVTDYSQDHLSDILGDVDCLVHLASAKMSGSSGDTPALLLENVELTRRVFSACGITGVGRVVNLSSRMVYGPCDSMPWSEETDAHPTTYYGLSKLCSEKLTGVIFGTRTSTQVVHLRIPQVFGVPDSGADEHVVTAFLRRAAKGEDLVVSADVRRQYTYVDDVVSAVLRSLEAHECSGPFNIAAVESISVAQAAREIAEAFGARSKVIVSNSEVEVSCDVWMDPSKAERILGFKPSWSFRGAVDDIALKMHGVT